MHTLKTWGRLTTFFENLASSLDQIPLENCHTLTSHRDCFQSKRFSRSAKINPKFRFVNIEKQMVPCKSTTRSHHSISLTDSKVRTTLHDISVVDSEHERPVNHNLHLTEGKKGTFVCERLFFITFVIQLIHEMNRLYMPYGTVRMSLAFNWAGQCNASSCLTTYYWVPL